MKQWKVYNYSKQKARGLRRRCRNFSRYILEHTESFTTIGGSHLWFNFYKFFGDTPKIPNSVRKFFVQTIINRAQHLISLKTDAEKEYRVICVFRLPELEQTLILIPPTQSAYERFFDGFFSAEKYGRKAIPIHQDYFESEWGFIIPQGLDVQGYRIEINEDEDDHWTQEEVWFIGELK
ncbi:hypothetical protein QF028_001539 [Neobacillus sp. B4I6]|uniref:DUF3916 domain-containing protein n=1 Tax=Neobacillus sp. B4I6 TaxID=3373925 RepID=UPI003D196D88